MAITDHECFACTLKFRKAEHINQRIQAQTNQSLLVLSRVCALWIVALAVGWKIHGWNSLDGQSNKTIKTIHRIGWSEIKRFADNSICQWFSSVMQIAIYNHTHIHIRNSKFIQRDSLVEWSRASGSHTNIGVEFVVEMVQCTENVHRCNEYWI